MSPKTGDTIWMRCEVRPGPFSNERFVKAGDWLGFVRVEALYEPIETGETWVLARIVEVSEGRVSRSWSTHRWPADPASSGRRRPGTP